MSQRALAGALFVAVSATCAAPPRPSSGPPAPSSARAGGGQARPDGPQRREGPDGRDAAPAAVPGASPAGHGAEPAARPALLAPEGALDEWFVALLLAQAPAANGRALVTVFGDSHTAGDRLVGHLRRRLARRFGDGGRGLVAVGKPATRHYYQTDVSYGSTGKWKVDVGSRRDAEEPFGIAGMRVWTRDRRATAFVEPCAECPVGGQVDRFELWYFAGPGAARVRVRLGDGAWQRLPKAAPPASARERALAGDRAGWSARAVVEVPRGQKDRRLTVASAGAGTLALFGVALERDRPGVIIDGLGVVGRTAAQLASWDWRVIGPQLAQRRPSLVILQYGTNEVDHADLGLDAIARAYDVLIARIRAAAPAASILLLGPPDMASRAGGAACDERAKAAPATDVADVADAECQWRTPERLLRIIEVQRAAAARHGVAFFDSFAALGGRDRIDAMVTAEPALAFRDRVHLTALGYERWADTLLSEMLTAYDAWIESGRAFDLPPPPLDR